MQYLKNYINVDDVDVSVLKNPHFIMSMNRLLKKKKTEIFQQFLMVQELFQTFTIITS